MRKQPLLVVSTGSSVELVKYVPCFREFALIDLLIQGGGGEGDGAHAAGVGVDDDDADGAEF